MSGTADGEATEVEALRRQLTDAAGSVDALRAAIHLRLRGAYWFGPRAEAVREAWESMVGPALGDNAAQLRLLADRAGDDAADGCGRGEPA